MSLERKVVVLAGRFRMGRHREVAARLTACGASVKRTLDTETDLLIVGVHAGAVEERARELQIAIWSERDLEVALSRGDGISARIEVLREVLMERPSQATWQRVVRVLDGWAEDDDLEVGLEYASDHLESWPDELRLAPRHWLRAVLCGRPEPRLRLVRMLVLRAVDLEPPADLARLVACADLEALVRLRASFCGITSEAVEIIARSPVLHDLRELDLTYNRIGPEGAVALATAATMRGLKRLLLDGNPIGIGGLEALAQSPVLPAVATQTWREQWARRQDTQAELVRLAADLQSSERDTAAATLAARELWLRARREQDLAVAIPALEAASTRADGHVAYFATLARIWQSRLHALLPTPPLIRPAEGEPDVSGIVRITASTWYSCSCSPRFGDPAADLGRAGNRERICGVCGCVEIRRIYSDGFGSNAGGWDCDEWVCEVCGCYTLYEHEWG